MFAKNIKIFALIVVVVTVIFSMVYQFTAVPAILSLARWITEGNGFRKKDLKSVFIRC